MHARSLLVVWIACAAAAVAQDSPPARTWTEADALVQGYLPKEDLGIPELLAAYPEADGREVIVAVLDTGVDLLHAGLQRTSTGLPKVCDYVDMTDAGLVRTDHVAAVSGGQVRGLSGRVLILGKNGGAAAMVHLGRICARTFFPGDLVQRILADRRNQREKAERLDQDRSFGNSDAAVAKEKTEEQGPVYDIVAFAAGDRFACAIDTDEDGDLDEETTLTDYRDSQSVARFPDELQLGVGANLAADGKQVSLLFDGGGHGTHVAGIIGCYYGDGDPLNGVAPGAQILALKVGNHRLGGATTHMSIIKALDYAARHGARVANASFGGPSFFQNGREETVRFAEQLIDETGMLCTFSAGNNWPALSTVGSPALGDRIFSIGASVSPKTQASNYGVLDPIRVQLFEFSSRGPLFSGGAGVDFLAPEVALSAVPTWFLESADSWNGTSMAAPQAAGALAVLLGNAQEQGVPATYAKVRRALERSSRRLPHLMHVEQGYGLLHVPSAWAELQRQAGEPEPLLWQITAANDTGEGAGLYDRLVLERQPFRKTVRIAPVFPEGTSNEVKTGFARLLRLVDVPAWARVVPLQHVTAGGAELELELDPAAMSEGLNAGEIRALDAATGLEELRLSLVMVRPLEVTAPGYARLVSWSFQPGDRHSTLVRVPDGASRARVVVTAGEDGGNSYGVTLSQASSWSGVTEESRRMRFDTGAAPQELSMAVEGGTALEIVAFSRWHDNRAGSLQVQVSFAGLCAADPQLAVPARARGVHWALHAPLGEVSGRIEAGAPDGRREPLAMTWSLARDPWYEQVGKSGTMFVARGEATLRARAAGESLTADLRTPNELDDFLDDAFWRIEDPLGVEVASGFLHQGSATFKAPARGDFTLRATVVAYGRELLEAGMERIVAPELVRALDSGDRPAVFADLYRGLPGKDALDRLRLSAGERESLYVRMPDWPAGWIYRGELKVRGDDGDLLVTGYSYDTRPAPSFDGLRAATVASARDDFDQALWLGRRDPAVTARDRLAALGEPIADLEEAELQVLTGDAAARDAACTGLRDLAVKERAAEHPDQSRLGRIEALLAAGSLAVGDRATATTHAQAALAAKIAEPFEPFCKLLAAQAEGKHDEAVQAARKLVELRPYDPRAARLHLGVAQAAGYQGEARQEAATWLDRFPGRVDEALELLAATEGSAPPQPPAAGE